MSAISERMRQEFIDKEYRHEYADGFLDSKIATQLKVLREQRGMTQQQLAQATGMNQARISVMEDVEYSSWSISTLRRYARAFDVRLDVEFKEFGTLPSDISNFNRESLQRRSFEDDPVFHKQLIISAKIQATLRMADNPLLSRAFQPDIFNSVTRINPNSLVRATHDSTVNSPGSQLNLADNRDESRRGVLVSGKF